MSDISELQPVSFPRIPQSVLSNDTARPAIAKASAYITLAFEEAGIDHTRDEHAALVTDATHSLEENCTPNEYLELAAQELALAIETVDNDQFADELQTLYKELKDAL